MAWERYVAIKKTINYKGIVTSSRVQIFAIASWVSAATPVMPSALYAAGISGTKQRYKSQAIFVTGPQAICLVAITIFYVLIYLETRKHELIAVPDQPLSKEVRNAKIERQVAKTTFLLTILLLISFFPAIVFHSFCIGSASISRGDVVQRVFTINKLNSLTNPILYFYRNAWLRKQCLRC